MIHVLPGYLWLLVKIPGAFWNILNGLTTKMFQIFPKCYWRENVVLLPRKLLLIPKRNSRTTFTGV